MEMGVRFCEGRRRLLQLRLFQKVLNLFGNGCDGINMFVFILQCVVQCMIQVRNFCQIFDVSRDEPDLSLIFTIWLRSLTEKVYISNS